MTRTTLPLFLLLAACGPAPADEADAPPSQGSEAVAPPFGRPGVPPARPSGKGGPVLFSAPRSGELGVAPDVLLRLTFPEPMDVSSAEHAVEVFCSCTHGTLPGAMGWRDGDTVLRFRPEFTLPHGAVVSWRVSKTLLTAGGRSFTHGSEGEFRVIRRETRELSPVFSQSGLVDSDGWVSSDAFLVGEIGLGRFANTFFTFELADLAPATTRLLTAELSVSVVDLGGDPAALGELVATPVNIGPVLGPSDLSGAHVLGEPVSLGEVTSPGLKTGDVTEAVADGFERRSRRDNLVQFKVSLQRTGLGGPGANLVWLGRTDDCAVQAPRLTVTAEVP